MLHNYKNYVFKDVQHYSCATRRTTIRLMFSLVEENTSGRSSKIFSEKLSKKTKKQQINFSKI